MTPVSGLLMLAGHSIYGNTCQWTVDACRVPYIHGYNKVVPGEWL
jgi:hypothetical protein